MNCSKRRRWRCLFGKAGQPAAFIEQLDDGWHVIVGNKDCGTMLTELAALELAEKINAGGGDGDK